MKQNQLIIGSLCALGCEIFYGMSYIFTKTATQTASAFSLLVWRFTVALVIMSVCIYFGFFEINLKRKSLKPLLLVALFNPSIYFIGETIGISNTTASESGVFLSAIPVVSMIASALILKEKPSKIQVLGIIITLSGVIITILSVGISSSLSVKGYTFLFLAVISYALYSVFVKKAKEYTETEITFMMLLAGTIVFGILALSEAIFIGTVKELLLLPFKETSFVVSILYQGIGCSILAFLLSNIAITKIGVNRTSSFIGISTVVSIIVGAFF